MAQASKTFRIFVSSTFDDLKAERNALQQHVFPKLRELCLQHGCRFQAIDLRWGVRDEAALDQQTMKICLGEIARCQRVTPRPNFIVLLGDRYGWRPLPAEIPASEFEEMLKQATPTEKEMLLWAEAQSAGQKGWYRRDDNAVPPVYCLQPREGAFRDSATWEAIEQELRAILLKAVAAMSLTTEAQLKYIASATEQEIALGAPQGPDAQKHVFCFFRTIKNLPLNQSARDFVDLDQSGKPDIAARARLDELKQRLRGSLSHNVYNYEPEWSGSGITTDHLSKLCDDVLQSLSRIILEEIKQLEEVDPLEKESKDHESFGQERAKFFTGRASILQTISDYVKGTDPHPLAVFGASGSGKTALLAQAIANCESRNAECVIVSRFVGATPASSDGRALLEKLCQEISRRYGADEASVPAEYQKLVEELPRRLALATADKPLIVFIDALDQLSDFEHARNLIWLPSDLPAHVRLIVSTLDPGECLTQLERKLPAANLVKLEPMPKEEGSALLDLWLAEAGRTLQDEQRAEVLGKFAANGLPLYLKLAFEETRRWKSYSLPMRLGVDIPGVVRGMFRRLSADHGQMLVSRSLAYLAAAKNGLTEDELLDVHSLDEEVFQDFKKRAHHEPPEPRLPVVVWSRLYFDLEAYLTERRVDDANLLAFFHRQFGEVVAEDHLAGDEKQERHRRLADYFNSQDYWLESLEDQRKRAQAFPPEPRPANKRKVSELPWQRQQAGQWDELERLLTDLLFLEAKTEAGFVYELAGNFSAALQTMPAHQPHRQILWLLEEALRRDIHFIAKHPTTLFQCLWNSCWWYDCPDATKHYKRGRRPRPKAGLKLYKLLQNWREEREQQLPGFYWIRSLQPPAIPLGTLQEFTLQGHLGAVTALAFAPNGARLASAATDATVRLWDLLTLRQVACLSGHTRSVLEVMISQDGQLIAATFADKTACVWNVTTGQVVRSWSSLPGCRIDFEPTTGKLIMRGTAAARTWDPASGEESEAPFLNLGERDRSEGERGEGPLDMRREWNDTKVVVRNRESGKLLAEITYAQAEGVLQDSTQGHEGVRLFTQSSRGQRIATYFKRDIIIWDLERLGAGPLRLRYSEGKNPDGGFLWAVHGGRAHVHVLTLSEDGQQVAAGFGDGTVRVCRLPTFLLQGVPSVHRAGITVIAFSPRGERLVSGSENGDLALWESASGRLIVRHELSRLGVGGAKIQMLEWLPAGDKIVVQWRSLTGRQAHMLHSSPREMSVLDTSTGALLSDSETRHGTHAIGKKSRRAISASRARPTYRLKVVGIEMVVTRKTESVPVAWYPAPLSDLCASPADRIWAGAVGNHLHLLYLEGQ